jgi:hypothetical protein
MNCPLRTSYSVLRTLYSPLTPEMRFGWLIAILVLCLPTSADETPAPRPVEPPARAEVEQSIRRGVAFLLKRQNRDGSWGSANISRPYEIYAPVPGAHQAFHAAVTALCISALIETGGDDNEVAAALDRGEAWLMANLPKVRRASPDVFYNSWTHAYGIAALVRMLDRRTDDAQRRERIRDLIAQQIEMLDRYEVVAGGWAYYDFAAQTQKPSGSTMSFVTAAVLVALHEAKQAGVEAPEQMIQRAIASLRRQRKPDFSYVYSEDLKYQPMRGVNRPGGSLGRSQACNLAMRLWGDHETTDDVVRTWLDRLLARNLWLDIGRKRPIPHESWFEVAGYFFYFGHYYAARCIELLPEEDRGPFQDRLAQILLPLQEKDGSWWDFPLFDYHQQYGTAFALMSLKRTQRPANDQ